jgi:hypothetical protein
MADPQKDRNHSGTSQSSDFKNLALGFGGKAGSSFISLEVEVRWTSGVKMPTIC